MQAETDLVDGLDIQLLTIFRSVGCLETFAKGMPNTERMWRQFWLQAVHWVQSRDRREK